MQVRNQPQKKHKKRMREVKGREYFHYRGKISPVFGGSWTVPANRHRIYEVSTKLVKTLDFFSDISLATRESADT